MNDILDAAHESLERPKDFAYWGSFHEEDGWGRAFAQHRDSDALDRSNWQVISKDLLTRFPDDVHIESANHWAVGWIETLRIRVLINPMAEEPFTENNITQCFEAVCEWENCLANYPIADESHFTELEYKEFYEYIEGEVSGIWSYNYDDDMPKHLIDSVYSIVAENCSNADDLSYKDLENAVEEAWIAGLLEDATNIHPNQERMELDNADH